MKEAIPQSARPRGIHRHDILRFTVFCLIFALILAGLSRLCYDDSNVCTVWEAINSGNGPDVLILGNSNAYTAFVPDIIEESTGLSCGVLGSSGENMFLTVENLKSALHHYTPEVVVLEAYAITTAFHPERRAEMQFAMLNGIEGMDSIKDRFCATYCTLGLDDTPFAVSQLFRANLMWSRWDRAAEALAAGNQSAALNRYALHDVKGYQFRNTYTGGTSTPAEVETAFRKYYSEEKSAYLTERRNEDAFIEFLEIMQEKEIPFIVLKTPTLAPSSSWIRGMSRIEELSKDCSFCLGVYDSHLSLVDMSLNLDDFYDGYHLNRRGAVKFTTWFLDQHFLPQQPEPDYQPVFAYRTESVEPLGDGVYRYTMENFDADAQYRFRLGSETVQDWSSVNFYDVALEPASADKLYCDMLPADCSEAERQILQLQLPFMKQNASVVDAPAAQEQFAEMDGLTDIQREALKTEIISQDPGGIYANVIHGTGKNNYPISVPYDWSCSAYLDTDTDFCFYMHGFLFLDASYAAYVNTGGIAYKDLIMNFMLDWINGNPEIDFDNKWAWNDDSVARRVFRMSWYYSLWKNDFSAEDAEIIERSLAMQANLLSQESFYTKQHNHGMYQDLGLTAYALLLAEEPLRQQYIDLAAERSKAYFEFCFTEDGVHAEHSPAYQKVVAVKLKRFSAIFSGVNPVYAQWLSELYERTGLFLAEIVMPDGSWPSIGDSGRARAPLSGLNYNSLEFAYISTNGQTGTAPAADMVFPQGGYTVMRSAWADSPEEATYLLFLASAHSTAHKHGDELSFYLYHKGDLFVEAGNRNYLYNQEMTAYSYSGYAHNVLCWNDQPFPVTYSSSGSGWQIVNDAAFDTKITAYDMDAPIKTVTGVQTRFDEVAQTRTIAYNKDTSVVTITDVLDVKDAGKGTLLYHLAAGIEVQKASDGWLLLRDGSAVARVSVSSSLPELQLSQTTGGSEGSSPYRTWIFEGKDDPQIGSLLKIDASCPVGQTEVITTIELL